MAIDAGAGAVPSAPEAGSAMQDAGGAMEVAPNRLGRVGSAAGAPAVGAPAGVSAACAPEGGCASVRSEAAAEPLQERAAQVEVTPPAAGAACAEPLSSGSGPSTPRPLVIDTNVVLDLFLFQDPRTPALAQAIASGQVRWLATPRMREECRRVLAYPHLQKVAQTKGVTAEQVLRQFDALSQPADAPPTAPARCKDADDQCFIDLAVAHGATLVSKDWHVRKLRKRLKALGVQVVEAWSDALG